MVIGPEIHLPVMSQCSIVTSTYYIDSSFMGTIGVIGPTRMEYERVISLVEFLAANLEKEHAQLHNKSNTGGEK